MHSIKTKLTLLIIVMVSATSYSLQIHEQWWQYNAGTLAFWPNLDTWASDYNATSRKMMRSYICQQKYQSLLDVPCGVGTDYFGLLHDGIILSYQGLEITPTFVAYCAEKNVPVSQGSIEEIPYPDTSFDIVYARHILEHLSYYHKAIKELLRVARFEVLIVFFIPPKQYPDTLYLLKPHGYYLYNNYYNKKALENYCLSFEKVSRCIWRTISHKECFLHIYLKH